MDEVDYETCRDWLESRIQRLQAKIDTDELLGEDTQASVYEIAVISKARDAINRCLDGLPEDKNEKDVGGAVGTRLGPLDDLPDALRTQIKSAGIDELEQKIMDVIKGLDGIASVDEILVGLYRTYERVEDREQLTRKLYRMTKKELLAPEPKRRGIYRVE